MEISTTVLATPGGTVYRASMPYEGGELVVARYPNKQHLVTMFVDCWGDVVMPMYIQSMVKRTQALKNALSALECVNKHPLEA